MTLKPSSSDDRLTWLLKWPVWVPARLAVGAFRRVLGVFVTPRTPRERRVDDTARQAGIRRGLRGLPAEHDQATAGPRHHA